MGTESDRPGATIAEMPGALAENCPEATALVEAGGARITFAELAEQVAAAAAGLLAAGLAPGGRVVAWANPSLDYLRLVLAASQAGLAVVPVDTDSPAAVVGLIADRLRAGALYVGGGRPLPDNLTGPTLVIGDSPGSCDAAISRLTFAAQAPLLPRANGPDAPFLIVPPRGRPAADRAAVITQRAAKSMCRLNAIAFRLPLRGALVWPGYPGGLADFTAVALAHLHVGASIEIADPAVYGKSVADAPPGGLAYAHAGALSGGIADALRDTAGLGTVYLPLTAAASAGELRAHAASLVAGPARADSVLLRGWNPSEHGLALLAGWRGSADQPALDSGLPPVGTVMPDVEPRLAAHPGSRSTLEVRSPAQMVGYFNADSVPSADGYLDTNRAAAVSADGVLYADLEQEASS